MSHLYLDESLDLADVAPGCVVRAHRRRGAARGDGGAGARGRADRDRRRPRHPRARRRRLDRSRASSRSRSTRSSSRSRPRPRITLVQALAKGDRDELAVQAATELGVDAVVPWAAARSVSRWEGAEGREGPRSAGPRIVREAVKQSIRSWLPAGRARHGDRRPRRRARRAAGCCCSSRPRRPR